MITNLAQIHSVRVISRTSCMAKKHSKQSLPEIAKELGADTVLTGTVTLSGDQLRLDAQLIQASTDRHLWAKSYQRKLSQILSLQNELAQAVAAELRVKLTSEEQALLATAPPVNPEAHLLYLKGMYHWYQGTPGTPEEFELSRQFFQRAIAADPTYAFGYLGLAAYYVQAADDGLLPAADAWPRGKAAGQKAHELDSRLGTGTLAATSFYLDWNWPVAEAQFKESLRLRPSEPDSYREYSVYLRTMHRCDEAIEQMRKAQEIDPLTSGIRTTMGWTYYYCRRYDQALDQFRRAVLLDKDSLDAHFGVAKAYEYKGQEAEAIAEWETVLNMNGDADLAATLRRTFTASGYRAAMRMLWRTQLEDLQDEAKRKEVAPIRLATLYALLDQKDQAFKYLEAAFQERSTKLLDLQLEPDFDNLHSDPRFNQLVRRIGLPP
jgi:tetratricopeptide (TPR) repeat protein